MHKINKTHIQSSEEQINNILKAIAECFEIEPPWWNTEHTDSVDHMEIDTTDKCNPFIWITSDYESGWEGYDPPIQAFINDSLFEFAVGDFIHIPISYFTKTPEQIKKELKKSLLLNSFREE